MLNDHQQAAPSDLIEHIAQQWDGCEYDAPGGNIDIGAAIRTAATKHAGGQAPTASAEPVQRDSFRACAIGDSNYAAGMLLGWNLCIDGDEEKFKRIRGDRLSAAAQAGRAAKEQGAAPVAAQAPQDQSQPYPPIPAPDVPSPGEAEDSYSRDAVAKAMQAAHDRGYSVGWDHGKAHGAAQAPQEPVSAADELDAQELEDMPIHTCGAPLTRNPHPHAGKPRHTLTAGYMYECIPCLVKARHGWASRAMKVEAELRDAKAKLKAQAPAVPPDLAADMDHTDWTPEEALRWYAAGKHFDTVNNRTRILDTGTIASHALKRTNAAYHAEHGADASFPAPAVPEGLQGLLAQLPGLRENPHEGDAVFRCGFNGALDVIESRVRAMLAAAPQAPTPVAAAQVPLPMDTAPRDGSMISLLVNFDEHSLEDDNSVPQWTIGFNNLANDGDDEWQFAGWCWSHDTFTDGEGTPIGWLPLDGGAPTPPASAAPEGQQQPFAMLTVHKSGALGVLADAISLREKPITDDDRKYWREQRGCDLVEVFRAPPAGAAPNRRPYNASGSLSEYGIIPECDAEPATGESHD